MDINTYNKKITIIIGILIVLVIGLSIAIIAMGSNSNCEVCQDPTNLESLNSRQLEQIRDQILQDQKTEDQKIENKMNIINNNLFKYTDYTPTDNTFELENIPIDCENNALNSVQLTLSADGKQISYNAKCALPNSKIKNILTYDKNYTGAGNGDIIYLDRQRIECADNEILSGFKMMRNPDNPDELKYNYTCFDVEDNLSCESRSTDIINGVTDGTKDIAKLAAANIKCQPGESLKGFVLTRPTSNSVKYDYGCCK